MTNKHNNIVIILVVIFFILDYCYIQYAIFRGVDMLFPAIYLIWGLCFVLHTAIITIINKLTCINLKIPILAYCLLLPSYFFIIRGCFRLIVFGIGFVMQIVGNGQGNVPCTKRGKIKKRGLNMILKLRGLAFPDSLKWTNSLWSY